MRSTLSRRAPRYRIDLAAKAQPLLGGETAVCRTIDVSEVGLCLDTAAWFPLGTRISVSLYDPSSGTALEVIGDVVREATSPSWTLGILLIEPPDEWQNIVAAAQRSAVPADKPTKRLRVLVVGDDHRQRGAMALYVTSGWDVLFATDPDILNEVANHNIELDAVIAELDAGDPRVSPIMEGIRRAQPSARRIVRGAGSGSTELVHRFVDRNDGLEALLDAITADIPTAP
ncbi:MAG TPA: PilZ domain-containing protein [Kofleriaceae bacterium]|jgi:hypothetical protein|nr:PilZ domain-containing protein [Kofleriaceae bacterium]